MPVYLRDFMKFRLGGFEAIKSAYMARSAVQHVGDAKDAGTLPTMTRV